MLIGRFRLLRIWNTQLPPRSPVSRLITSLKYVSAAGIAVESSDCIQSMVESGLLESAQA